MEDAEKFQNTTILSDSYMNGVKRLTGNRNKIDEEFRISEEIFENRKKSWSWLFEKFSEVSDDIELNIHTLKPDTESSDSYESEIRIPVKKTIPQIQYWVNTGNPPYQAAEAEENDTDGTLSLSESEGEDFTLSQSLPAASMIVNNKQANNSGEKIITTESSASSVDTATYILNNANTTKKIENDVRSKNHEILENNIIARSINSALPKVLLNRLTEIPEKFKNSQNICIPNNITEANDQNFDTISSKIIISDKIIDNNKINGDKSDRVLDKNDKNHEIKDSEVTFESKESGIGSIAIQNYEKGAEKGEKKSSISSLDEILPSSQSTAQGRRKLFRESDIMLDIISPVVGNAVENVRSRSSCRKSFHPALDSPSSNIKKTFKVRPRLLTLTVGRTSFKRSSRNYSINKRNKNNQSFLTNSRIFNKNSRSSLRDKVKTTNDLESSITRKDKKPDNLIPNVNHADVEERKKNEIVSEFDKTRQEKTSPMKKNSIKKIRNEKLSTNENSIGDTSSLSSQDVSQIINEELKNRSSKTLSKILRRIPNPDPEDHLTVESINKSDEKLSDNDQGSIFKSRVDNSLETRENRIKNILNIKKNLCATDLRSSGDGESYSNSSPDVRSKLDDVDSISNASTILLSESRKRMKSLKTLKKDLIKRMKNDSKEFQPFVILHDFLNLRNCCGDSEKRNNEFWLRKLGNEEENLKEDDERVEKRDPDIEKSKKIDKKLKSKKQMDQKILSNKKIRLENELSGSENDPRVLLTTNLSSFTKKSQSVKEKTANLRTEKLEDDFSKDLNYSQGRIESDCGLEKGIRKPKIDTIINQWESMLISTSSDEEEDLLKTLSFSLKNKSSRMMENNRIENTSLHKFESTKTHHDSYTIVFSSSEEEDKAVKKVSIFNNKSRKVRRQYSNRNRKKKGKDLREESKLTMCLEEEEDECAENRSENLIRKENENDKLEKQSLGVNRRSKEIKKSKQSSDSGRRDYLARGNEEDCDDLSHRNLRSKKIYRSSEKNIEIEKVIPQSKMKIKYKENDRDKKIRDDNSETPVDRVSDSLKKRTQDISEDNLGSKNSFEGGNSGEEDQRQRKWESIKGRDVKNVKKREILFRKIARAGESSESPQEDEGDEGFQVRNYKDRRKIVPSSKKEEIRNDDDKDEPKIDKNNKRETSLISEPKEAMIFPSDDELSDIDDDIMTLLKPKNYAGDSFRHKNNRDGDKDKEAVTSRIINSKKNSTSPIKSDINIKSKDGELSSSKKKRYKNRNKSRNVSNIVFRTKEYWESDSDNT